MDSDCSTSLESHPNDKKHIKQLEKELKNCSLEIGYLQDELGVRNIEANCKYENFKNYLTRIEELEAALTYAALESQCEIESLKLDMLAMEERCFQAESLSQQMAEDKAKMQEVLEECEMQLHEAHDTISFIEMENNELKLELNGSERRFRDLHYKVEVHLSNWLKDISSTGANMHGESHKNLSPVLNVNHFSLKGYCTCEEVLCPLVSKLILLETWDENVKNELQEMANQVQESELLVEKLKEELREEKLKAKEEAEDLTQAMAELRYEITGMLEEECKHRASIEQASLRRIQDLEEQVQKEQRKSISAIRLLREVHKLSETQCNEVQLSGTQWNELQHLKGARGSWSNHNRP